MKKTLLLLALFAASALQAQNPAMLSPSDFGYDTCSDGLSRYWALYHTHVAAKQCGAQVDYSALESSVVELTQPRETDFIPLGRHTDFKNITFVVLDTVGQRFLFRLGDDCYQRIDLDPALTDGVDFGSVPELRQGSHLLILEDKNPWVAERIGYGNPAMRCDILFVRNGLSLNRPVASYNTPATQLAAWVCPVNPEPAVVENLHLRRHPLSTHQERLLSVYFENDVTIRNISVFTPQYKPFKHVNAAAELVKAVQQPVDLSSRTKIKHTGDAVIYLHSSTNVTVEDFYVDGTYSVPGTYGYAVGGDNLWNTEFHHVVADGNWGIFGTNNMSMTLVDSCDINRFDIHCYGRDVVCRNCTFRGKQTQFSSLYGTLTFVGCHFVDCIPVRIRSSYNAYTPFDIVMKDCSFDATRTHHSLVNVMLLDTAHNSRPELYDRNLPNLRVEGLTVTMPRSVRALNLYHPTGTMKLCKQPFGYMSSVKVDGVRMLTNKGKSLPVKLNLWSKEMTTANAVVYQRQMP